MKPKLALIEKRVEEIDGAFVGNDYEGHRRGHEAWIERTIELRRMRVAIQEKTVAGLIWAIIVWVGMAAWHELQRHF